VAKCLKAPNREQCANENGLATSDRGAGIGVTGAGNGDFGVKRIVAPP